MTKIKQGMYVNTNQNTHLHPQLLFSNTNSTDYILCHKVSH